MTKRVLIVDDERSMCDLLATGLKRRGFEVIVSTSGEQALEVVESEPVDVTVTDLNMAGIDGIQLCSRIVANRPDIPVVVLTAFGSFETAVIRPWRSRAR